MANLDPQVHIRIIDLAAKWAEHKPVPAAREEITTRAEYFNHAYKAIVKTVSKK